MSSSLSSSSGLPSVQWSSFCHSVSVATRQCDSPAPSPRLHAASPQCAVHTHWQWPPHRTGAVRVRPSFLRHARTHTHILTTRKSCSQPRCPSCFAPLGRGARSRVRPPCRPPAPSFLDASSSGLVQRRDTAVFSSVPSDYRYSLSLSNLVIFSERKRQRQR